MENYLRDWQVEVAQLCMTLCNPTDCSPPASAVHVVLQARRLEWVASAFSRGSSQPRDQTQVSCFAGGFFTMWATREAPQGLAEVQAKAFKNTFPKSCPVIPFISHWSGINTLKLLTSTTGNWYSSFFSVRAYLREVRKSLTNISCCCC